MIITYEEKGPADAGPFATYEPGDVCLDIITGEVTVVLGKFADDEWCLVWASNGEEYVLPASELTLISRMTRR